MELENITLNKVTQAQNVFSLLCGFQHLVITDTCGDEWE